MPQINLNFEVTDIKPKKKARIGYNGYKHLRDRLVKISPALGEDKPLRVEYTIEKLEGKMRWR